MRDIKRQLASHQAHFIPNFAINEQKPAIRIYASGRRNGNPDLLCLKTFWNPPKHFALETCSSAILVRLERVLIDICTNLEMKGKPDNNKL